MPSGVFLRDPQDFLHGRDALAGALPAVEPEGGHATLDGVDADVAGGGAAQHQAARVLVDGEHLVDGTPAPVAGAPAVLAALAAVERDVGGSADAERVEVGLRRRGLGAGRSGRA